MKELEIIEKIELYLEGKLYGEELSHFEEMLNNADSFTLFDKPQVEEIE